MVNINQGLYQEQEHVFLEWNILVLRKQQLY